MQICIQVLLLTEPCDDVCDDGYTAIISPTLISFNAITLLALEMTVTVD